MERSSGILLPISSLPSPYGIGTLGKEARQFVDFLAKANQRWWQILPVGPTSYGDSPYQSFSAYAGNPYFIDLEQLMELGLLEKEEVEGCDCGSDPTRVDYGKIYNSRFALLEKASKKAWERYSGDLEAFISQNKSWLPDYALFMALKRANGLDRVARGRPHAGERRAGQGPGSLRRGHPALHLHPVHVLPAVAQPQGLRP